MKIWGQNTPESSKLKLIIENMKLPKNKPCEQISYKPLDFFGLNAIYAT